MKALRILTLVLGFTVAGMNAESLMQRVPGKAAEKQNPYQGNGEAERSGAKLYDRECASCHGAKREGLSKAPALVGREIQNTPSGALFWVLTHGSRGRGMPSFAHLPEARRWQIVTFLQGESK